MTVRPRGSNGIAPGAGDTVAVKKGVAASSSGLRLQTGLTVHKGAKRQAAMQQGGIIAGVSGVILAGGTSSRMGSNKALLPYQGGRFIEAIHRQLSEIFAEVFLVTNHPEQYEFLCCRKVPDLIPGAGALSGIHSGLYHSGNPCIFAVACDMPYLNDGLLRHLAGRAEAGGVVIPEGPAGLEPLHAVYGRDCLAAIEDTIGAGNRRIVSFFDRVQVVKIKADEIARFDPSYACFSNINTPEEYFRMRECDRAAQGPAGADTVACSAAATQPPPIAL